MKFHYFFMVLSILCSCQPESNPATSNEGPAEEIFNETKCNLDTTLSSGAHIVMNYYYANDSLVTSVITPTWDSIFYLNDELAAFSSSINPMNDHVILWSTNQFAGMREGCGTNCNYEVVIPLIPGRKPARYFLAYTNADEGIELEKNLIAFNGDHNSPDGYPMIKIENMLNGKRDSIAVDTKWDDRIGMNDFVDTIFATMDYFFIGQLNADGNLIAQKSKKVNLR